MDSLDSCDLSVLLGHTMTLVSGLFLGALRAFCKDEDVLCQVCGLVRHGHTTGPLKTLFSLLRPPISGM